MTTRASQTPWQAQDKQPTLRWDAFAAQLSPEPNQVTEYLRIIKTDSGFERRPPAAQVIPSIETFVSYDIDSWYSDFNKIYPLQEKHKS